MVRAIFFLLLFVPFTLFIIFTGVPITFLDPTGRFLHNYGKFWGRVALFLAGATVKVSGLEKIPDGVPVIFMGNHQSNFDILSLYAGLPRHFSWIAKEELFRIPLFGYAMKRAGYLPLDRSDGRRALKTMESAAEKIRGGVSVVIFPEGTRSMDGNLLPFKRGGFLLAARAGVPIVPFTINGSARVNPAKRLVVHPGTIAIAFGDPIPTGGATGKKRDELIDRVREAIERGLES
ncbi:MAG: 1-acyl-sn-glycerol-3-phosphate acyltransferase [Geobacteraceae bacterium]|nr:1-acyl-sn-glycerol-3-phosphate acyltransferase [Geobacteraceae bacterium]